MTDAISNYGQRAQSDASLRSAMEKANKKSAAPSNLSSEAPAPTSQNNKTSSSDELLLSNVAERAMAQQDFDRVKIDSIKQAIHDGQYPLSPRKIAESFHAIEQMIRE
jgi:negative regulator of flagellin synthesis FlgM